MTFLPDNYEIPQESGNYYKFVEGQNRFRILGSPIIGHEYWIEEDGKRKPVRKRMDEKINIMEVPHEDQVKHFWALPVWNYDEEKVQILEITQKTIQKSIKSLSRDEDWGSPVNYDLVITRTGEKLETEYQVQPKPAKELDPEIQEKFKDTYLNLDALFSGGDPFKEETPGVSAEELEKIDVSKAEF